MRIALGLVVLGLSASPAAAQDRSASSVSAGYGFIHDRTSGAATTRINFNPSLVGGFTGRSGLLGGVIEFGWAQGSATYPYTGGGLPGREQRLSVLAGPRLSARGRTTAFGQVLAGFSLDRFHSTSCNCNIDPVRPSTFVVQPGLGVDVALGARVGVRVEGDLAVGFDTQPTKLFRMTAGLLIFTTRR